MVNQEIRLTFNKIEMKMSVKSILQVRTMSTRSVVIHIKGIRTQNNKTQIIIKGKTKAVMAEEVKLSALIAQG